MRKTKLLSFVLVVMLVLAYCAPITSVLEQRNTVQKPYAVDMDDPFYANHVSNSVTPESGSQDQMQLTPVDGLSPEMAEQYEADGSIAERQTYMTSIETANKPYYSVFKTDYAVNVSNIANIIPSTNPANMPTKGNANVLVFLVEFPDALHPETDTVEKADDVFFGEEDSLKSFYYKSSYQQLTIDGDVQNWYMAAHERDYYVQNGIGVLYKEVLDAFDATLDYSDYDADNNGYIDGLYLHFTGDNSGWGSTWWSYVTYLFNKTYDGISVGSRACLLHTLDVSTVLHESGHLLGLPDYYSYTIKGIAGNYNWVGSDDAMIAGKGDHNAVSKMLLGWIEQVNVYTKNGSYELQNFAETGDVALVYPFGESSGDSFIVLEKSDGMLGTSVLKAFRVNAATQETLSGEPYYIHSNMYGEVPFVELIAELSAGDVITPYDDRSSTHYYNEKTNDNTFSGITISVDDHGLKKDSVTFDLLIEMVPSLVEPPIVHTSVGINQITATIDYSVPFSINTNIVPYLVDENGQKIAKMSVKAIYTENGGYYLEKASCVLRVASYQEWGFDGKNEIIVGSDQDYLLQPGKKYTIVIPEGAFRTVMGDIEAFTIDIVADDTAVQDFNYQKVTTFDRCSEYITLADGRVAYAYVTGSSPRSLKLAILDTDMTLTEYTLVESGMLGYVGICQLSDESICVSAQKSNGITMFYKFSLDTYSVEKYISANADLGSWMVHRATKDGFYFVRDDNRYNLYYIDNNLESITNVKEKIPTSDRFYVVDENIILNTRLANSTTELFELYDKEGTLLVKKEIPVFFNEKKILDIDTDGKDVFVAYYDIALEKYGVLILNTQLEKKAHCVLNFAAQPCHQSGKFEFKCLDDGYYFSYAYIRQYNPKGIVGMFNTENYEQGILMDSAFNVKSIFDVSYTASAAVLGITQKRYVVGDEYGYYVVDCNLTAAQNEVVLESDVYEIDNNNYTITKVPEGTTIEAFLQFIRANSTEFHYEFLYTHAVRTKKIESTQVLSCKYELHLYNANRSYGVIYTFPELPLDYDSKFNVNGLGSLLDTSIETDKVVIMPEFVKRITTSKRYNDVEKLVTSANIAGYMGVSSFPNVKEVVLQEGCTDIYNDAFASCKNLVSVSLPGTLTTIGREAFEDCISLKTISLPHSLVTIDYGAFDNCTSLREIVIPASVKKIGNYAFACHSDFLQITYLGTREQWDQIDFGSYDWESDIGDRITFAGAGVYQEVPEFKFTAASLTLYDNLELNYKVDRRLFEHAGYVQPYVEFTFNNEVTYVSEYTIEGDYYVFNFPDISPEKMNDKVYATLYARNRGVLYNTELSEYSVATYCYNTLKNYSGDEYTELRTLLVDLLNYGAQTQLYTNYKTGKLANASLTDAQKAWATVSAPKLETVLDKEYVAVENPSVDWLGAGLNLQNSITLRFKIAKTDLDGLKVKVTCSSGTWWIDSSLFEETTDGYYIYFSCMDASQLRETLYLTVYKDNTVVSNTIRYSIASYVYSKQDTEDTKLYNLLEAMMKYGDSAYAYTH